MSARERVKKSISVIPILQEEPVYYKVDSTQTRTEILQAGVDPNKRGACKKKEVQF
jgi:hypothetical protein